MGWLKHSPLHELQATYGYGVLCETGCHRGEGIAYGLSLGLRVYSCDISEEDAWHCQKHYGDRAVIECCPSVEFLEWFCTQVDEPAFFWLDAHWPAYYHGGDHWSAEQTWPMLHELEVLREHRRDFGRDVLLIDDVAAIRDEDNEWFHKFGHVGALPYCSTDCMTLDDLIASVERTHRQYVTATPHHSPLMICEPKT